LGHDVAPSAGAPSARALAEKEQPVGSVTDEALKVVNIFLLQGSFSSDFIVK
jgi:hypothetical protein